jgi:hypothetical protein
MIVNDTIQLVKENYEKIRWKENNWYFSKKIRE